MPMKRLEENTQKKIRVWPGVVAHVFNPIRQVYAFSSRPAGVPSKFQDNQGYVAKPGWKNLHFHCKRILFSLEKHF